MKTPLRAVNRLDSLDLERFEAMVAADPFQLFLMRVQGELSRARTDCETQDEPAAIRRAQGQVKALRTVLALPDIMIAEMRKP